WSPDSRSVAFKSQGKLKSLDLKGGSSVALADAPQTSLRGGTWNGDGVIVFGMGSVLWKVPASGGAASKLTALDAARRETEHAAPQFLPDGRKFLYLRGSSAAEYAGIFVGSLDAKPEQQDTRRLLAAPYGVQYVASSGSGPGHLLFMRDGSLMAQA